MSFIRCLFILYSPCRVNVVPGVLHVLNHNKKIKISRGTFPEEYYVFSLSLLLALLTPPHSSLPPFFPLPDVSPCPDSLLLLLLDVFQAVPEKPQWDRRQTEQSSNPRSRLQHQGHGQ